MIFRSIGIAAAALLAHWTPVPASPPQAGEGFRVGLIVTFERKPPKWFPKHVLREMGAIFKPAGLELHWESRPLKGPQGVYDRAVVVHFRGNCDPAEVDAILAPFYGQMRLGWTALNDGEVIPFSGLHCDQVAQAVRNLRHRAPSRMALQGLYTRVVARVLAHELLHVLLRTPEHDSTPVSRAAFHDADLELGAALTAQEIAELRRAVLPKGARGPLPLELSRNPAPNRSLTVAAP